MTEVRKNIQGDGGLELTDEEWAIADERAVRLGYVAGWPKHLAPNYEDGKSIAT